MVFTVPEPIAALAFQNQSTVYDILFRAASETLRTDRRRSEAPGRGDRLPRGAAYVGTAMQHHPHVHCVVPGGGIAPDGESWIACRSGFFLSVPVLSRMFRRLFLHSCERAFAAGELRLPGHRP